ncbi:MAG: DUF723 domain-containing protein [Synechococcaceae cyanobacterium MAG-AL1]|nr:DUF723 domain-containing protein [Candidatus Regnicoccus frigidus MAG-AL1]
MSKRLSIAEFKERATAKFGGKFGYDRVGFIHSKEPVEIYCPDHGYFTQLPHLHLRSKYGCPKCGGTGKKTTADFVKEAKAIHGDRYGYDKTHYVNSKTAVTVTCQEHGDFHIAPCKHTSGRKQGCPECARLERNESSRMSKGEFIRKAIVIHGDRYSYDKVEYTGYQNPVTITCSKHGDFQKSPSNHLSKTNPQGCPKCKVRASRKTTEQFVAEARVIHADRYDYSLVKYRGNKLPVEIFCPTHGAFEQEAKSHLHGHGCPDCAGVAPRTTEDFITEAREVWGDKYYYAKVDYVSNNEKVIITCRDHGDFMQRPHSHLIGYEGCSKCHGRGKTDMATFIEEATEKHDGKFDYSEVAFDSIDSEITIICPIHGRFRQKAKNHLRSGCPDCGGSRRLTTEEFIEKARGVHGDLYDYSRTRYLRANDNVEIHCPYHGPFHQRASHHLGRSGCPICRQSRGEFRVEQVLKRLGVGFEQQKRFPDCRNVNELPFDFFVGDRGVIEFHGEQHFWPVDFGKGESDPAPVSKRDQIKERYCREKGIPMLIVRFDEIDDVEAIVKRFVAKLRA